MSDKFQDIIRLMLDDSGVWYEDFLMEIIDDRKNTGEMRSYAAEILALSIKDYEGVPDSKLPDYFNYLIDHDDVFVRMGCVAGFLMADRADLARFFFMDMNLIVRHLALDYCPAVN